MRRDKTVLIGETDGGKSAKLQDSIIPETLVLGIEPSELNDMFKEN